MARLSKKFSTTVTVHYEKNGRSQYLKTFYDSWDSIESIKKHILSHGCKGYGILDVSVFQPDNDYLKSFRMRS